MHPRVGSMGEAPVIGRRVRIEVNRLHRTRLREQKALRNSRRSTNLYFRYYSQGSACFVHQYTHSFIGCQYRSRPLSSFSEAINHNKEARDVRQISNQHASLAEPGSPSHTNTWRDLCHHSSLLYRMAS